MLQIIACITMLIDHIGVIYEISLFRVIGRLSMPCYAFLLCNGCNNNSKIKISLFRLFRIFAVSQIPFYYLFGQNRLNVCFTWLCSAAWLYIFRKDHHRGFMLIPVVGAVLALIPCDYGVLGFGWVLLFEFAKTYPDKLDIFNEINYNFWWLCFAPAFCITRELQIYSLLAIPVIYICVKYDTIYLDKKYRFIYRWFYPVHMCILKGLNICLQ